MPEPINPTPEPQPGNSVQQNISARPRYASAAILVGVFVGILIGVAGYHYLQGNLQKITHVLITASYIAFGALVLSLLAMFAFREYLTRSIFGSNAHTAGTVIQDAQKATDHLTDRVTGHLLRDAPEDIRQGVRSILPRLLNLFFWGRIRNWWWQWIIGIFVSIGGLTGTVLLMNQNALIQRQMSLDEANRRSALVVLMSNIMDKVDREIEKQQDLLPKGERDSARFQLSQSLIGQIAALSHSFKPYRYMSGDTLIPEPLSPERGLLLITLTLLPLDTPTLIKIYRSATFQQADLQDAILSRAFLREADLRGANLDGAILVEADLTGANLSFADLDLADLRGANLIRAKLTEAKMRQAILVQANLRWAYLRGANLREVHLEETNLRGAYLRWANLRWANLRGANLVETNLREANLIGADLREADLSNTFSLYQCKGIPENILTKLKQEKPELFEDFHDLDL
ncbi:MAG: pentapeptide repeat-containing protein [Saprospiraceae bacterium]|nr:pentapeptide repeat-containing protein [Saprospiraceae bacterium]